MAPKPLRLPTLTAIALAALALGLSACAFKKDGDKPVDPKLVVLQQEMDASRPILEEDLSISFIAQEELYSYRALVQWKTGKPISLKVDFGNTISRNYDVRRDNQFLIDCKNNSISFTVEVIAANNKTLTRYPVTRACPIDYEIRERLTDLTKLNGVNGRLKLRPGAIIALSDKPLKIDVDTLDIDATAIIETFSVDRNPKWYLGPVTKEPEISIRAKTAKGFLSFALNGIDGAAVPDTVDIEDDTLNGANGNDGETETFEGQSGLKGADFVRSSVRCTKPPTNGQDGNPAPHGTGEKGLSGNSGIGTSQVRLEIESADKFRAEVIFNPGFASKWRRGSVYKGGKPGKAGSAPAPCKSASDGKNKGKDSEPGANGDPGQRGSCGVISASSNIIRNLTLKDYTQLACKDSVGILQPL